MAGGRHSRLTALHFDFAGKIGLEPAPQNSLRAPKGAALEHLR
jgi:hypothetical protein